MYRAFLSLYFLIVASVVLVGLAFDALLGVYAPDDVLSESDKDLLFALERQFLASPEGLAELLVSDKFSAYQLADFANTQLAEQLRAGEAVVVHKDVGERQLYKLMPSRLGVPDWVLMISQQELRPAGPVAYNALIVVFYLAIAAIVFLWVWPLSRDLRKLQSQTRLVGQDHLAHPLAIGPTSPVFDLAESFNRMSARVKELLASHKEMTYAVSHELRTPLARMKFALEMAQSQLDPAKLQKQLVSVKEDVAEMDTLINQLLAYAGFEQSTQSLQQQPGDMAYLISCVLARVKTDCSNKELGFRFENRLDQTIVTCEWHLLERAIQNLLQNAARFAASSIRITLAHKLGCFCVEVEDDGPGVAEQDRERVFESFVRMSNHINAKSRGFGLGLAIVRRVMLWHGGTVSLDHSSLGGARFILRWPSNRL